MPNQNSKPKENGQLGPLGQSPLGASTKINECSDTITVLKRIIDAPIVCPPGYALDKKGKCRPIYK